MLPMWTVRRKCGPKLVNHAVVCVDDHVYSFGGYNGNGRLKDWDIIPINVFNLHSYVWRELKYKPNNQTPRQMYGHTAVLYKNKVYLWGGRNNSMVYEKLYCFDLETLEFSNPATTGDTPPPTDGHGACVINKEMFVFGGFNYFADDLSDDVYCLQFKSMNWILLEPSYDPPYPKDFATFVPNYKMIYVFGGRSYSDEDPFVDVYSSALQCLDTASETWIDLNPTGELPDPRRSHVAWIHKKFMYIFGGFTGDVHHNDLYRWDIDRDIWERINLTIRVPTKRRRAACVMYKNKLFLFGGAGPILRPDGTETEETEDYNEVHVLDFFPSLRTLCMSKVNEMNIDDSSLSIYMREELKLYNRTDNNAEAEEQNAGQRN